MAEDKGSKTEQPTARRLQQAREKGQVAKSMEVNTCVVLLAAILTLFALGDFMYDHMTGVMRYLLGNAAQISIEGADATSFFIQIVKKMAIILAPVLIIIPIMGIASNLFQIGPLFSTQSLKPSLSKLNPITGFGKMFSSRSLMELAKSIGKIIIIGSTAYLVIKGEMETIVQLSDMTPAQIGYFVLSLSFEIFIKTIWIFVFLAAVDLAFQKYSHTKDLRMSKEEVKEEMKQTEGDPLVKSRIRSTQREMARKRMMAAVPEADVVVTNPTHIAIALLYKAETNAAPVVVAKGQARLAERIKKIARENNVPVMEDKPLARALFQAVDVGQEIPVEFYQAVAEVLSYIYRMKGKRVHG